MKNTKKLQWLLGMAAGAAMLAVSAGCHKNAPPPTGNAHGEDFRPSSEVRDTRRAFAVQASNGARADATLRTYHFDGPQLNSLGEERLDLMTHNSESASPLVIYLDLVPSGPETSKRQEAVAIFLKDHGFKDDQVRLQLGYNPHSTSSAAGAVAPDQGAAPANGGPASPMPPAGYSPAGPANSGR
jgi:hypothetical protein